MKGNGTSIFLMMKKDFGDTHDSNMPILHRDHSALHCSAEKSSLLTLEGDYRLLYHWAPSLPRL